MRISSRQAREIRQGIEWGRIVAKLRGIDMEMRTTTARLAIITLRGRPLALRAFERTAYRWLYRRA